MKPGDELRFVKAADLSEYARARITAIDGGNASPYTVTLDRDLPASLGIGDLVANVTRAPGPSWCATTGFTTTTHMGS